MVTQQPPPIQFRPGDPLGRWIDEFAARWKLTPNETARHLAALAASGLSVAHHSLVVELVNAQKGQISGPHDFTRGCEQIKNAINSANLAREGLRKAKMNQEECSAFVKRFVEQVVHVGRARRSQAQEKLKQKATVRRT